MKMFEIEFETCIPNEENSTGNWFNYYEANTKEDAINMFNTEMHKYKIKLKKVIAIRKIRGEKND